uniref:Uncharacterized protein n=1 Tax=Arundo donax TaxID=35708 RepID=A0A0A9D056_ARUDO
MGSIAPDLLVNISNAPAHHQGIILRLVSNVRDAPTGVISFLYNNNLEVLFVSAFSSGVSTFYNTCIFLLLFRLLVNVTNIRWMTLLLQNIEQ